MVAENADVLAFLAQWTGLTPPPGQLAFKGTHQTGEPVKN
jgi:hypothetical protein